MMTRDEILKTVRDETLRALNTELVTYGLVYALSPNDDVVRSSVVWRGNAITLTAPDTVSMARKWDAGDSAPCCEGAGYMHLMSVAECAALIAQGDAQLEAEECTCAPVSPSA